MDRPAWASGRGRLPLAAVVVLALVLALVAVLRPDPEVLATVELPEVAAPAAAAATVPVAEPDGTTVRLRSGGRDRAVLVQTPTGGAAPRGVVLVLGPHSLTAARTAQDLRFDDLRARGYVVAYPSTLDGDWNAGRCCGTSQRTGVDDVRFLQDVRGRLLQENGLPPQAVGLVGYSTGGQMVYRTVCEHPGFARAAVVVAGSLETECAPGAPLPATLVVHGMEDATVPYAFTTRRTGLLDYAPTPMLASVAAYADAAGCDRRVEDRTDGRQLAAWPSCRGIRLLSAVGMPGTGHGWAPLGGTLYATRFVTRHLEG